MTADEEDIERHDAHYRMNPSGHKELVVKKKGEQDDETLNELADSLMEVLDPKCSGCGLPYIGDKEFCGNCRSGLTPGVTGESIAFSGPLPTGGGAGSPEQQPYQRARNQPDAPEFTGNSADMEREAGESPNNMTSSTPQASDGPERSRSKSKLKANARGNDSRNKYITGYRGDSLDYGATHSESFTGTGAIAIVPGVTSVDDDEDDDDEESTLESVMNRSVINEWEPKFAGGGDYSPSDYQMPSPTGDGVAERKPKKEKVGKYDTDTSQQGEAWPRKHNDTPAMCDVDEDGVENKPQGSHESTHGEPDDGHQTEVGHNWPDEPKNSGNGVAEPFEGNRWSDGGTLSGGSAQDEMDNKGRKQSMPSDGPITGTSGPQLGQPQESWSPNSIGALMEGDDVNVQALFDNYARQTDYVCLEDFQELLRAHGGQAILDEGSILRLMDVNKELVFHEGHDASGRYWVGVPFELSEGKKPWETDDEDGDDDDSDSGKPWEKGESDDDDCDSDMNESRKRHGRTLREFQVRPARDEAMGPSMGDPDMDPGYDEQLAGAQMQDRMHGPGPYGGACPECGAPGTGEEACAECGCEMGGPGEGMLGGEEQDWGHVDDNLDHGFSSDMERDEEWGAYADEERVRSPRMMESLSRFIKSAKSIVERNSKEFGKPAIGEALQHSWRFHAAGINPRTVPSKARQSIQQLMKSYPAFNPLNENDAMDSASGSAIGGKGSANNSSSYLAEKDNPGPDEIQDHGDPLGSKQKNNLDGTPVMKRTEKGMSGTGNYAKTVKENVTKLAMKTRRHLNEAAKGIKGKYGMSFSVLVQEEEGLNRTPRRRHLAEALADAEEILQIHPHQNVVLETYFHQSGSVVRKSDMPMVAVKRRGPLVSEGRALFRFQRTAEQFADELVTEGATCRLAEHNWGHAVSAKVNYKLATKAFRAISEGRK